MEFSSFESGSFCLTNQLSSLFFKVFVGYDERDVIYLFISDKYPSLTCQQEVKNDKLFAKKAIVVRDAKHYGLYRS